MNKRNELYITLDTVVKVKVKLSLGEWRYSSIHSLTSVLGGGEWSDSRPGRFTPRDRAPGTHWIGGWVGGSGGIAPLIL
jgi:hypothetical protein